MNTNCVVQIPEDLLLEQERVHEGSEFLLYKREVEPSSPLQEEKHHHLKIPSSRNVENLYKGRHLARSQFGI